MRIFTVDAFTDKPFTGNPAGVCILNDDIPRELKQSIAQEINYSETAFVIKKGDHYSIQWFTPLAEVDLCGHATLAAAHVLFEYKCCLSSKPIEFSSKSGTLIVNDRKGKIEMDFPQYFVEEVPAHATINTAFGINPVYTGKNDNRYLIEIEDENRLIYLIPDFQLLNTIDLGRFIITAKTKKRGYDFVSRYFAPKVGVPEDPVTGSAHCYLAAYWAKKLKKNNLTGFQASQRSGTVECELRQNNRVILRGNAVLMHELVPHWS